MAGKPGSKEEHAAALEWAKENVKSAVAQICKEQQEAVKRIDRSDEEYW